MRSLLMIAYHFPPLAGSSGIQRTLSFARHLPRLGWKPLILAAHPRAFSSVSDDQLADIPSQAVVERAFALDSSRHLAIAGRYPAFAARPDRWITWWLGAVPRGLSMIRKHRPAAIWSTYPIATAHKIGSTLHRLSGLPWVADFRDPMTEEGYPADPEIWRSYRKIERTVLRDASRVVFVTPGLARLYGGRYGELPKARLSVIENGYDEEIFGPLDGAAGSDGPLVPGRFTLLHSGVVYPAERDPTQFFQAMRSMLDGGALKTAELRVRLRAPVHDQLLRELIGRFRLEDIVEIAPAIPYRQALLEMMRADGLLVLQASNCNDQIPAKAYEYIRCRRPVFALTDPAGDTAGLLRKAGIASIARLDSAGDISVELRRFLDKASSRAVALPSQEFVLGASRLHRTRELAGLLDEVCAPDSAPGSAPLEG